jgi:hypothetical protein
MNERSAEAVSHTRPVPPGALSWEIDVPLITNPLVRRQLLLVAGGAGLMMALLMTFVFATTGEFDAIPMMWLISLLAAVGLGVLLFVVALVFFGNRVRVRFTLDEPGVLWETVDQRARTGSRLALLAGLLGASPQTAGAGALGIARETAYVRWEQVARVVSDPRHRMVILRGSWRPMMMVVCRPEDYDDVVAHAKRKVAPDSAAAGAPTWRRPLARALLRTAIVALAAAPTFALSSTVLDLDLLLPLITLGFALATVWLIPLFGWVVIGCVVLLMAQLTWLGIADFRYLYGAERALFFLAYLGLGLLAFLGRRALRGKLLPPLLEP